MKIKDLLEKETGTFAGVYLSQDDEDTIISMVKTMGLPNPITKKDIHLTLLYSEKPLPNYIPNEDADIWVYPTKFYIFKSRNGEKDILVLKLDSTELIKRHKELLKEFDTTFNFPEYLPHITLTYDLDNYKTLKEIENEFIDLIPKELHIVREYKEPIRAEWQPKNNNNN